jgi:hypothetical protein
MVRARKPPASTDGPTRRVGRNQPCTCGSGKKYKRCCGRPKNAQPLTYSDIRSFYLPVQKDAEEQFIRRWGLKPDPTQLRVFMHGTEDEMVALITAVMQRNNAKPEFVAGVRLIKCLATRLNQHLWTDEEKDAYYKAMVATGAYVEQEASAAAD